jgi:dUTP pyrophosphatase
MINRINELLARFAQELSVPLCYVYYVISNDSQIGMAFVVPVFFLWMAVNKYINEKKMIVKIKKTDERAVMPTYGHDGDACMDLTAISKTIVEEDGYGFIEYGFGLSTQLPADHVMLLFPRSSVSTTGLILANSVGVIDETYRGEIKARFKWVKGSKQYEVGDRVAQFLIIPRPKLELELVDELEDSDRDLGGFGSTGS